jgi:hypothetical protein
MVLGRKVIEMKRIALALIAGLFVVAASTTAASAAPPIDVDAQPGDQGAVVTVYANRPDGTQVPIESIKTGQLAVGEDPTNPDNGPGLCATGVIHNSCTPASEAAPQK